jgi:hypothetical protein
MTIKTGVSSLRIPWWSVATVVVLSIALTLAVLGGRTVEAVIVGAILVPTLALLGVWLTSIAGQRGRGEKGPLS